MLREHELLNVIDVFGKLTGLTVEVNWDPADIKNNECKVLKFNFPDGSQHFVKREDFIALLWVIGREEDQQKMVPQKLTTVRWYETVLKIKAKKDIHKGEDIICPIKLTLPADEKQVIGRTTHGTPKSQFAV